VSPLPPVSLGHAEVLRGARALALCAVARGPTRQHVGQVVLGVVVRAERTVRLRTEPFLRDQRSALVVQTPAIGAKAEHPRRLANVTRTTPTRSISESKWHPHPAKLSLGVVETRSNATTGMTLDL